MKIVNDGGLLMANQVVNENILHGILYVIKSNG